MIRGATTFLIFEVDPILWTKKGHSLATLLPACLSMDGRGRCLDNVFVERLWRTVKYEYVYLWCPEGAPALAAGLTTYFGYYNEARTHQSLEDRTPAEVYGKGSRSRQGCRAF